MTTLIQFNPSCIFQEKETLRNCLESINGDEQCDIPFAVWLLENPESIFPFPGKINLYNHDCLHILQERGISLFDEALVVGFTMGNDSKTNRFNVAVFKLLSSLFYPRQYRFNQEHFKLFDIGFDYGRRLKVKNINHINFKDYQNKTVEKLRKEFGIEQTSFRSG